MTKFLLLSLLVLCINHYGSAQDLWNKKIDEAQKTLCKKSNNGDCLISISNNSEVNLIATNFLLKKVDEWQKHIENYKTISNNDRVKIYRVLLYQVNQFNYYAKNRSREKDFNASLAEELFGNFDKTMEAHLGISSLEDIILPKSYLASRIFVEDPFAPAAKGYAEAKSLMILKECNAHHDRILKIISRNPNYKYADSLIEIAAMENQDKIYDFAQCTTCPLYNKIKNHPHPLVQTLFKMAQMESGRSLTPFLDLISRKEITIDSINKIQQYHDQYFKLLVNTRQKFLQRIANKDTPILAFANFNNKIKDVAVNIVYEINEAHTKPDNIRFAPLNNLNPQELYYLAVYGINDLYTSSFIRGVFAQLLTKLNGTTTDKLLEQVKYDYFRKFIKISAGYNKLSAFLKLMPDSSAKMVMNKFIGNLITNENVYDIEDAVDVADAFGGIGTNSDLNNISTLILQEVKRYQKEYVEENNTKGETVYRLFDIIFNSFKDTSANFSKQLGLPPITKVDYKTLTKDTNKTVVKVYFYSDEDKDGQNSFANFMVQFQDKTKWKIVSNPYFVNISSIKGKPIQIFANRALYDPKKIEDLADTAKLKMSAYVQKMGLNATFIVHRGHSYHVPISLDYIENYDTAAKIIILGSCGSYQNLIKALEISPDAHIITSKQTGSMRVNDPMLKVMFTDINAGKSIIWPEIWPRIKLAVGNGEPGEMFNEYIPPHQNLGMLFIKAYRKQMEL